MFDEKTVRILKYYVYALVDPNTKESFYIGKGNGNRVFDHTACALKDPKNQLKYKRIREVTTSGREVEHLILKHGLSGHEAVLVESMLIDFANHFGLPVTNVVSGHGSNESGIMTSDEIIRKFSARKLISLGPSTIIININKSYERAGGNASYYKATKEAWAINKDKLSDIQYVLSEYKGLIVAVFKVKRWYPVQTKMKNGKFRTRWGFEGADAEKPIQELYLNRTIKYAKKPGSAMPVRYTILSKSLCMAAKRMGRI